MMEKTFDELLKAELAQPVTLKNANGATILPMEAMVKSVINNAMKGDLSAINFVRQLTRTADPAKDDEQRTKHRFRVAEIATQLTEQLKGEKAYDGQDLEIEEVAEIAATLERLNEMMAEPEFEMVSTDMKTGKQTVSPVIALRDKQRELFQQQLAKLRSEALSRIFTRTQMKL